MKTNLIRLAVFLPALAATAGAADIHLASDGNDANPGTAERPLATLERARDVIRERQRRGPLGEAVTVRLRGGTYPITREVRFGPEDSGTARFPITYLGVGPGAVVLDGGRRITGWRRHDDKLWVARLPEVAAGHWRFRQLFVDGQPRVRARTPNEGYLRVAACPEGTPKTVNYHKDYEPHKSVFFENNLVYWREGKLFSKNWRDAAYEFYLHPKNKQGTVTLTSTFECDWNLYFNPGLKLEDARFDGGTWEEWRKRGKDTHSRYADPRFVNPERGDFTLQPDSPALALGFRPIDLSRVGPRVATGPQGAAATKAPDQSR